MSRNLSKILSAFGAAGAVALAIAYTPVSQAFNFGDMMNPGKWMGGGDRYDDDWYGGPGPYGPGPYGPGSYGGGPWGGGPYGGPYGPGPYGGPGYGAPGVYGAPGYQKGPTATAPRAPASSSSASENVKDAEIEALKRRIEELESRQQPYAPPPAGSWGSGSQPSEDWGSAPAFRPMGKY